MPGTWCSVLAAYQCLRSKALQELPGTTKNWYTATGTSSFPIRTFTSDNVTVACLYSTERFHRLLFSYWEQTLFETWLGFRPCRDSLFKSPVRSFQLFTYEKPVTSNLCSTEKTRTVPTPDNLSQIPLLFSYSQQNVFTQAKLQSFPSGSQGILDKDHVTYYGRSESNGVKIKTKAK